MGSLCRLRRRPPDVVHPSGRGPPCDRRVRCRLAGPRPLTTAGPGHSVDSPLFPEPGARWRAFSPCHAAVEGHPPVVGARMWAFVRGGGQSSVGCLEALSTTRTPTGPFLDSSLSPSCSVSAVKSSSTAPSNSNLLRPVTPIVPRPFAAADGAFGSPARAGESSRQATPAQRRVWNSTDASSHAGATRFSSSDGHQAPCWYSR